MEHLARLGKVQLGKERNRGLYELLIPQKKKDQNTHLRCQALMMTGRNLLTIDFLGSF